MRKGLVLLIFITASFFIYPFLVFGEFDDELFPEDQPKAVVEDKAEAEEEEEDFSMLNIEELEKGCLLMKKSFFVEIIKRCNLKDTVACNKAFECAALLCEKKIGDGCALMNDAYEMGRIVKKNPQKAVLYAKKACTVSDDYCFELGRAYLYPFLNLGRRDVKAGLFLLDKACFSGNSEACFLLGGVYNSGKEVSRDNQLAFKYYFEACKISKSSLWCNIGSDYESGEGVPRNPAYAFKFFNLLCENGDALKCAICGVYYGKGLGVNKDLKQSAAFMDKACALGSVTGCAAIGFYYVVGLGVEKNMFKGAQFYRKGCDMDDARSCLGLGELYFSGNGVPKSSEDGEKLLLKSARLFKVSCSSGNKPDCDHYAKLYDMGYEIKD